MGRRCTVLPRVRHRVTRNPSIVRACSHRDDTGQLLMLRLTGPHASGRVGTATPNPRHSRHPEEELAAAASMRGRTMRTASVSPASVSGDGRTVSMPWRLPYTMSVRYLSPIMTSRLAGHLHQTPRISLCCCACPDHKDCVQSLCQHRCTHLVCQAWQRTQSAAPGRPRLRRASSRECLSTGMPRRASSLSASSPVSAP